MPADESGACVVCGRPPSNPKQQLKLCPVCQLPRHSKCANRENDGSSDNCRREKSEQKIMSIKQTTPGQQPTVFQRSTKTRYPSLSRGSRMSGGGQVLPPTTPPTTSALP
ncbi:hypothetical protein QAD02_008164 [Eretmocerus hayati]|uniref:Uncharacterized protein n=1 Tax=Eretmocerus hayati TaxID=131215 RepID=A0ACC2N601_9HYME|nr:hypothetical protein QAD02_008164 [Eretmocerus hayati]